MQIQNTLKFALSIFLIFSELINFDIDLRDFRLDGQQQSSKIDNIKIIVKLFASNKGTASKGNWH